MFQYGTTPLVWAARKGHGDIVDLLLQEGASVDNAGMYSWTALIVAAKAGYTEVVEALLRHHPNVNAGDKVGACSCSWIFPPVKGALHRICTNFESKGMG